MTDPVIGWSPWRKASRGSRAKKPPRRPPGQGADLHVHTTHSDGACSPCEVVVAAANVGLKALAITDHDTLSAIAVARPEAERLGVELIAGVELTAEYEGREVHILGHFLRDDDPSLVAATAGLRLARAERIRALVDRLEGLGLSVDLEALGRAFPRATLGASTWPTGWRGPGRSPALATPSPATSATAAPRRSPSPGWPGPRRSP